MLKDIIKAILFCKINKVSFQIDRYSKQGIFHDIFQALALWTELLVVNLSH